MTAKEETVAAPKASEKPMAAAADYSKKRVVMVTGGTGLVGKGIEAFISECPEAAKNESWVYLSSGDGDLRNPVQPLCSQRVGSCTLFGGGNLSAVLPRG